MHRGRQVKLFLKREKKDVVALISPNKMAVLPDPLPDGRRSGGDEGLGSRLEELAIDDVRAPKATQAVLEPGAIIYTLKVPTAAPYSSMQAWIGVAAEHGH